jgi:hypothetical protein
MNRFLDILEGAELLSGTIAFFAILGMLAFFAYAVLARLPEERFQKIVAYLDSHLRPLGLAAFGVFLLLALLFYLLTGR